MHERFPAACLPRPKDGTEQTPPLSEISPPCFVSQSARHLIKLLSLAAGTVCYRVIRRLIIRLNLGIILWRERLGCRTKHEFNFARRCSHLSWGSRGAEEDAAEGLCPWLSFQQKGFRTCFEVWGGPAATGSRGWLTLLVVPNGDWK